MRGFRWFAPAVLLIVLATVVRSVGVPLGREAWMRLSSAIVANSTSTHGFDGKPVSFLGVGGPRWVSWSEQKGRVAAYYVLVLLPSAPVMDKGRSSGFPSAALRENDRSFGDGDHRRTIVRSWPVKTGGRIVNVWLEARYDAVWRTVEIGGRSYPLSNGNVFVVRLGEGSQPGVTQVDTTITRLGDGDALEGAVRSKLPGDEAVQRALRDLHRRDECESRPEAALAGGDKAKSSSL